MEELYEEILFIILHDVGCEAENETCPGVLFSYIQEAFKVIKSFVILCNFQLLFLSL